MYYKLITRAQVETVLGDKKQQFTASALNFIAAKTTLTPIIAGKLAQLFLEDRLLVPEPAHLEGGYLLSYREQAEIVASMGDSPRLFTNAEMLIIALGGVPVPSSDEVYLQKLVTVVALVEVAKTNVLHEITYGLEVHPEQTIPYKLGYDLCQQNIQKLLATEPFGS